jgi:uridine phosphorylase
VSATIHLQPTAPLADRVLLPGPKMFNHNRGLWGYTGPSLLDGEPLTIQSTGMGGPSAAIVIAELAQLGARTLVRVGTCGGLDDGLALGELLIVSEAICEDGTSRALAGSARVSPDAGLLARLLESDPTPPASGAVVSTDLFYDTAPGTEERWRDDGARAVEMEAATLFALAARRGLRAAAVLIVSDLLLGERRRIEPDALREAEHRLGERAVAALA